MALAEGTAKLLVDDGYFDQLDNGRDFATQPGQDFLRELVHGEPGDPPPLGAVASITTATALVDRMAEAVGWAIEIAQHVTAATDAPVSVLTNVYGQMGEISWIGVQPDLAAADSVRLKLSGDMDYLGRLAATKDLYVPASVTSLASHASPDGRGKAPSVVPLAPAETREGLTAWNLTLILPSPVEAAGVNGSTSHRCQYRAEPLSLPM